MNNTKIEWCNSTWNPVTGCKHGCEYCYARRIANRFGGWEYTPGMIAANTAEDKTYIHPMKKYYGEAKETEFGKIAEIKEPFLKKDSSKAPYPFGFTPTFHRYRLDVPKKWSEPRTIFVCSMADLFGEWVPDEWIEQVFAACEKAPQHTYLFLTKNPNRYLELTNKGKLPQIDNMWYGSSVTGENIQHFVSSGRYNTFLSIEPLLFSINMRNGSFQGTKWIIVGAETGTRRDKVVPQKEWVSNIVEYCDNNNIPVFMKDSLIPIISEESMRREFPWSK